MKTFPMQAPRGMSPRLFLSGFTLLFTCLIFAGNLLANDVESNPPSAQVTATLVSPVPGEGFKPGDLIQVQVQVTNLNNSDEPFRVDIRDFPYINDAKTTDYITEYLRFGNNVILREATFSHGLFFRTYVEAGNGKIAEIEEVDIQFADESNAYTWLLDDRFRNGSLGQNDIATLNLTIEFVAGGYLQFPGKTTGHDSGEYELKVDYTDYYGGNGSASVSVPIDLEDYEPPTGSRSYTTVVKPDGLQAGESYMIEVGLINYGDILAYNTYDLQNNIHATVLDDFALVFDYGTFNLRLNNGFTPYYYNRFYQSEFESQIPNPANSYYSNIRSFSVTYGDLFETNHLVQKSVNEINGPGYSDFAMSYLPETEEFWVRSVPEYCGDNYSSSEIQSCEVDQFSIYPLTTVRVFMQGVATLEQAGGASTLTGTVEFEPGGFINPCQDDINCKTTGVEDIDSPITEYPINEEIPIGAYTITKTVSDPCFESGEKGHFMIVMSGADFRKVPSKWHLTDMSPEAVSIKDVLVNFSLSDDYYEYAVFSSEPGGGMYYNYNNTYLFSGPYKNVASSNSTNEYYNEIDFGWYDQLTFKLPFKVLPEAAPGLHTNDVAFHFQTNPFDSNFEEEDYFEEKAAYSYEASFEEVDKNYIESIYESILEELGEPTVITSVDFLVGCSVVSGYKFHDLDADGIRDADEPGLEGWEITIQGSEGTYMATTDASGYYEFPHVKAGNYQVRETQQVGWVQSAPGGEGIHNISVSRAINSASADFGNYQPAIVFGYKYVDLNGSGSFDEGEPGLEGIRVYLLDLSANLVAETFSAADGSFSFEGLMPGNYSLFEDIPDDMYQSQPGYAVGGFYNLSLKSGDESGPNNFGNYFLTSIQGDVYYTNAAPPKGVSGSILNDRFAAPGVPVSGVRTGPAPLKPTSGDPIELPGSSTFTVLTDEDGHFHVDGLIPGLYTISIVPPANSLSVTPNPLDEVLVSGGYIEVEFGLYFDELGAPEVQKSSITGSIFADANGDGLWQYPAESGVSGKTVTLTGTSKRGASIERSTTTNMDGTYVFDNLPAGRFVVNKHAEPGVSISEPISGSHVIELGENEQIGSAGNGAPGGSGWLQGAIAGEDVTFGSLVLAIDTDLDGTADSRLDLSGLSSSVLGGTTGQTSRPYALTSMAMYGNTPQGEAIRAVTPGLIESFGEISGSGAQVGRDVESGLVITADGSFFYTSDAIPFVGSADRWPIRNTPAVFNAIVAGEPVSLRDIEGNVIAHILYAEHTPMFGADFAAENADFGDAPVSYGTLRATPNDPFVITPTGIVYPNDGARHLLPWTGSPTLTLGSGVTADADGQPTATADGDTDNGVELPTAVAPNASFTATVTVAGEGLLSVWVDANRNGMFESSERQVSGEPVETGEYEVTLNSGAMSSSGTTIIRVRLTSQAGVGATGLASNGEVEDLLLTIDATMAGGGGGLPTSDDGDSAIPTSFALHQNFPNPFNPTTVIPYDLASSGQVRITVYDVTGRPVATVLDASQNAGRHQVTFDAAGLPSGVYMVRLEAGGQVMVRKLTLLK